MRSDSKAIWTSGEPVSLAARRNCATTPDFFSVARDIRCVSLTENIWPYFAGANSTEKLSQSIGLRRVRSDQSTRLQPAAGPGLGQPEKRTVGAVHANPTSHLGLGLAGTAHRLSVPQ